MSGPKEFFRRPTFAGGIRPTFSGGQCSTYGDSVVNHSVFLVNKAAFKYKNTFKILGDSNFRLIIEQCFKQIESTSTGKKLITALIALIQQPNGKIHIMISKGPINKAIPTSIFDGWKKGEYIMYDHLGFPVTYGNRGTGKGCGTNIKLNFNFKFPEKNIFLICREALFLSMNCSTHIYSQMVSQIHQKRMG